MDELDNIISLEDADGNERELELLDVIEYDGESYAVLLPPDEDEVLIMKIEPDEDPEYEMYVGVEDEDILDKVFDIFREKYKDEFDFK